MSEELRWILLGFGAVLLAWIYLSAKWRMARSGGGERASHAQIEDAAGNPIPPPGAAVSPSTVPIDWTVPLTEPVADIVERLETVDAQPSSAAVERRVGERRQWLPSLTPALDVGSDIDTRPVDLARRPSAHDPRKIITLRLAATPSYEGQQVLAAFESVELEFGRHAVFHRLTAVGEVVFSVASMTEPGTFEVERMSQARLAGLVLYALLPGPLDGPATFTQLLNAATQLQHAIGGELQDERGVTLTSYRINRIREEVSKFRAGLS